MGPTVSEEYIFRNKDFDLSVCGPGRYLMVTYNTKLTRQVNKLTGYYGNYVAQDGEEPIFKLTLSKVYMVLCLSFFSGSTRQVVLECLDRATMVPSD